jgi:hypothetical protein
MPTITVPDSVYDHRYAGHTLQLRTERPAWIVRGDLDGWVRCSVPVVLPHGEPGRVHVPLRQGLEAAIAAGMAVEVIPEADDPVGHPIPVRPATGAP